MRTLKPSTRSEFLSVCTTRSSGGAAPSSPCLVALSLFLLTAYFGESAGGGLHATQRGALEVLAPIQEGANKALKPARDLFGWFGDTLDAQDERDRLQRERDQLRGEVAQLQVAEPRARAAQGPAGDQHRGRPRSSTTP